MATFTRAGLKPPIHNEVLRRADQNYYLNSKGEVVTEEDHDQQVQLVGKGCPITKHMVEKYGDFDKVAQDDAAAKPEADAKESSAKKSQKTKNEGAK